MISGGPLQLLQFHDSVKIRGKGHKLKHQKLHMNVWKNVLTLRVTQHWNRSLRGCGALFSGDIQNPTGRFPVQLTVVSLL